MGNMSMNMSSMNMSMNMGDDDCPMMKMYFHSGTDDCILFKFWRPGNTAVFVISCIIVFILCIIRYVWKYII